MATAAPKRHPSRFERHPWLTVLGLVLAFAFATDVVFTHVYLYLKEKQRQARLAGPRPPRTPGPQPSLKIKNEVFHHGLGAFWDGDNHWGPHAYRFATNSLAFIDREPRVIPLEAPGRRIVFIGDSFTEGSGVSYDDTFVGRVDAALEKEGVSVLNAAAVSYSPIIYYRKMRYYLAHGLTFDELVVFIDISDIQDEVIYRFDGKMNVVWDEVRKAPEEDANRRFGAEPQPEPLKATAVGRFLDRHTIATARAYRLACRLAVGDPYGSPTGRRRGLWTVDDRIFAEYGREGLENAAVHMDQLLELCREHGIRLVVAVYPWPDQIVRGDVQSRQSRYWRGWASARDVDFIDYFPRFIDGTPAQQILERYFIPGDIHWNQEGHRLVANVFLDYYRSRTR
jgi:hypothetical protein